MLGPRTNTWAGLYNHVVPSALSQNKRSHPLSTSLQGPGLNKVLLLQGSDVPLAPMATGNSPRCPLSWVTGQDTDGLLGMVTSLMAQLQAEVTAHAKASGPGGLHHVARGEGSQRPTCKLMAALGLVSSASALGACVQLITYAVGPPSQGHQKLLRGGQPNPHHPVDARRLVILGISSGGKAV